MIRGEPIKTKQNEKKTRNKCSPELKEQAVKRAEKDGVAIAARDLAKKFFVSMGVPVFLDVREPVFIDMGNSPD